MKNPMTVTKSFEKKNGIKHHIIPDSSVSLDGVDPLELLRELDEEPAFKPDLLGLNETQGLLSQLQMRKSDQIPHHQSSSLSIDIPKTTGIMFQNVNWDQSVNWVPEEEKAALSTSEEGTATLTVSETFQLINWEQQPLSIWNQSASVEEKAKENDLKNDVDHFFSDIQW